MKRIVILFPCYNKGNVIRTVFLRMEADIHVMIFRDDTCARAL